MISLRPFRTMAVASAVPTVAFLAAIAVADHYVTFRSTTFAGLLKAFPFYLGFVSLFCVLPLAVAPAGGWRWLVLGIMTAVSVVAGTLVMTTDDAQAGLAVLLVPYMAVPLAMMIGAVRGVAALDRHLRLRR